MAFRSSNLSVLAYANGFTLWHYTTTDTGATVDSSGYFNEGVANGGAYNQMKLGDMILANVDTTGTPLYGIYVVRSRADGVLDVADLTNFASANTD